MLRKGISVIIFCCLFSAQSGALDLTKVNISYQYDLQAKLKSAHRVVSLDNQLVVFFNIEGDSLSAGSCHFLTQKEYGAVAHDTLKNYQLDTILFSERKAYFRLTLPPTQQPLLLISIADSEKQEYYLFDVKIKSLAGFPTMYPVDKENLPIFSAFVTTPDVQMKGADQFHAYGYRDDFKSADPPMGIMKTIAPSIEIDSSFVFDGSSSAFEDFKFYLIQEDTLSQNALTLLKCPEYYPKLKTIPSLVGPLTYITTESEIKSLTRNYTKKSFEVFWINTYGTKFRAKSAIRMFYEAIENTNLLFTDYKQGWKTDRGMLYLIYGAPDQVRRDDRTETWVYNGGLSFEFIRISTLFAPTMYSLKRSKKYENAWYNQVGEIRKGL